MHDDLHCDKTFQYSSNVFLAFSKATLRGYSIWCVDLYVYVCSNNKNQCREPNSIWEYTRMVMSYCYIYLIL